MVKGKLVPLSSLIFIIFMVYDYISRLVFLGGSFLVSFMKETIIYKSMV